MSLKEDVAKRETLALAVLKSFRCDHHSSMSGGDATGKLNVTKSYDDGEAFHHLFSYFLLNLLQCCLAAFFCLYSS